MNIVISGASSGIGYQTALRFAEKGTNTVFALGRRPELLQELAEMKSPGTIIPVIIDITTYDYTPLETALTKAGITAIDVVIHNAGLLIHKPFELLTGAEWEEVYRVNVFGAAQLTRFLMPFLGKESPAHLVTIGSIGGVRGSLKFPGLSAYSSSKGALGILTECLAEEFKGKSIAVNCLALGSVQTEMLTKAFPGYAGSMQPQEVSRFIYEFSITGWRHFNGKILEVSTTNP